MKITRAMKTLLVATVLVLSLFAARGTAWADDAGISEYNQQAGINQQERTGGE